MASNAEFQMVGSQGWWQGFANLFNKEEERWLKPRKWLAQVLIWLVIANGILALVLWVAPGMVAGAPQEDPMAARLAAGGIEQALGALTVFISLLGMACTIGVVIMTQDAIILEKQTGTAAWVLSKPASRTAFILSKLAASFVGVLVTIIAVQGAVAYLQIYLATHVALPILPFLGALGLTFLCLLFYLSLALMLGTFFNARGGVIAIPLVVAFSYQILLGIAPWLGEIMPWNLTLMLSADKPAPAMIVALGLPLPTVGPIIATFIGCLIFTGVAIWKFNREEF